METKYYDGTKLLSMKDINGDTPEIYLCTGNRSAGKTTYFSRYFVNRFLKYGELFGLLYRFNYELDSVADKFFGDIADLFFQGYFMTSKSCMKGIYHELYLHEPDSDIEAQGTLCGYAISLNSADQIKKNSHLFSKIDRMLFDEFQSETNHYCADETTKFQSVHTSIARGHGKQVRYLPVYMLSNTVSLINPYFTEFGISARIQANTKFLKGEGFVLEQTFNESASEAQKESAFNRAFKNSRYNSYSAGNVYLNDNNAFIEKPLGKNRYKATIAYNGREYAIRDYYEANCYYVDDSVDTTFPTKISVTTSDHKINYIMLRRNSLLIDSLRAYFEMGYFRFKDLLSKEALMTLICYTT